MSETRPIMLSGRSKELGEDRVGWVSDVGESGAAGVCVGAASMDAGSGPRRSARPRLNRISFLPAHGLAQPAIGRCLTSVIRVLLFLAMLLELSKALFDQRYGVILGKREAGKRSEMPDKWADNLRVVPAHQVASRAFEEK